MGSSGTQAVDRAAMLVSMVVSADEPLNYTELVDESGLARSTTSRLLAALERARLVERNADGCYLPGSLFALYASRHDTTDDVARVATPILERLRDISGETANIAVPRGGTVVHVAQADSHYLLGPQDWTQVEVPSHVSALSRSLMAHGALPVPPAPLAGLTAATITNPKLLARDLALVRRRGYAVTIDELEVGLTGIGAAVLDRDRAVAAIGISGPTARLQSRVDQIGRLLVEQADTLSALLQRRAHSEGAA
ncbi:MAG: IclR family transcriptional regulator [Actinomycetales bacterium]